MTKKQVKDLKSGDDLGNCVIVSDPVNIGTYLGQKDRMKVVVRFTGHTADKGSSGESTRIWGRYTTVSVKDKQL